jgi:cytochrome c oxidase subunit 2
MHARRWFAVSAAMLAVALLIAGCGSSSKDSSGSNSGGGASATTAASGGGGSDKITLTAKGIAFDQTQLNMPAGKQVTVTLNNQDSVEHSFTFKDAKADKDAEGGETAEVSFTAPAAGSYEFHCKYHPKKMKGTVTVA